MPADTGALGDLGSLVLKMTGDENPVLRSLDRVENASKKTRDALNDTAARGSGSFKKLGLAAGGFAGAVVAGVSAAISGLNRLIGTIGSVVHHMIVLGAAAEDLDSKFKTVFGETTELAEQRVRDLNSRLGVSRQEIKQAATAMQDLFVPLGFTRDTANDLSFAMAELAQDLASFSPEAGNAQEAANSLQSALIGNHEAVRKYGVIITEATLNQQLMAMGVEKGTKAASEQQKILARLQLILAGTTDAQGDLVRTSDSFTNSSRSLWGQLQDLGSELGTSLLPLAGEWLDLFEEGIHWIDANQAALISWADQAGNATRYVLKALGGMIDFLAALPLHWETFKLGMAEVFLNVYERVKWFTDNSWEAIKWLFTGFLEAGIQTGKNFIEFYRNVFQNFGDLLSAAWKAVTTGSTDELKKVNDQLVGGLEWDKMKGPDFKEFEPPDFDQLWEENARKWAKHFQNQVADSNTAAEDTVSAFEKVRDNMPDFFAKAKGTVADTTREVKALQAATSAASNLFKTNLQKNLDDYFSQEHEAMQKLAESLGGKAEDVAALQGGTKPKGAADVDPLNREFEAEARRMVAMVEVEVNKEGTVNQVADELTRQREDGRMLLDQLKNSEQNEADRHRELVSVIERQSIIGA